ncbi:uncharacterized protein METZ01_LOCUS394429, partial [marine metagenome]
PSVTTHPLAASQKRSESKYLSSCPPVGPSEL